jgi:hypothetical protein
MYIFYDFETSGKEFLHQILSYSFILVDDALNTIKELNGIIKPNRMEIPQCGAILTNKLSIQACMQDGESEYQAAQRIYQFLETVTQEYGATPLVGFNSARFDFKHYEKLLLKYGLSPTFYGKITSLDIYQYAKYCALQQTQEFPFIACRRNETDTYSFRLEDLAKAFECLDTPQTHDARDDVLLTIALTNALQRKTEITLSSFQALQHKMAPFNTHYTLLKEPYFPFEQGADTPLVDYHEWTVIGSVSKSTVIALNLKKYMDTPPKTLKDYAPLTRYLNTRSNACICTEHALPNAQHTQLMTDDHIKTIGEQATHYFDLFPTDWDIEYKPWSMGFNNIDRLGNCIGMLHKNPDNYRHILDELLDYRRSMPSETEKANNVMRLYNRYYLNHHPNPKPEDCKKYLVPRYVTGSMYRNSLDFVSATSELSTIDFHLTSQALSDHDRSILEELKAYTTNFISKFSI